MVSGVAGPITTAGDPEGGQRSRGWQFTETVYCSARNNYMRA